ncbi:hypothetical protein ABW636_00830 [Aquimarina sp. 2201CG1-2-11]|uniref:hypothetical protein n=1 Tax=Aquimarina discodermiae TaxID=3231043 RepID=UPI0034637FA0
MNYLKIKKVGSILLICIGAVLLISQIATSVKNYYIQSIGIVLLMLGIFLVNTSIKSKTKVDTD